MWISEGKNVAQILIIHRELIGSWKAGFYARMEPHDWREEAAMIWMGKIKKKKTLSKITKSVRKKDYLCGNWRSKNVIKGIKIVSHLSIFHAHVVTMMSEEKLSFFILLHFDERL